MKKLLLIGLMLIAGAARAETVIDLTPQTCSYSAPGWGSCSSATFTLAFKANNATLIFGNVSYTTAAFSLVEDGREFTDADGNVVYVSNVITYHAKAINAGRAHYYRHYYTLDSGSVTLP